MKTEQINIRVEADLVAALDRVAREEALDRTTAVRRLLEMSIRRWELERAVDGYRRGELSLGRAAEESGLTQWELLDAVRAGGIAHPLTASEAHRRLDGLDERETLPDYPPKPGGVLLVGINPAPPSVKAGHYYQGTIGRRLWRRLEGLGLLRDVIPGVEDESWVQAGHGLTDLVKRAARSSAELADAELAAGVDALREKVREWQPGLVLFVFKAPATHALGRDVTPGPCGEFEGVPAFLLTSPYARRDDSAQVDAELRALVSRRAEESVSARTQRVTATDIEQGRIRLRREAKRFFPATRRRVQVVLRGERVEASYDPRTGPDRERSAVLRIGRATLERLVHPNEALTVTRTSGRVPRID